MLTLKKVEFYYEKFFNFNIYEKNKIKKFFNFILFYFFFQNKKKTLYYLKDKEYFNFEIYIKNLCSYYYEQNSLIKFYYNFKYYEPEHKNFEKSILKNIDNLTILSELKNHNIIKLNFIYIYKIKISSKKNYSLHIEKVINSFLIHNFEYIIDNLNYLKKNYYNVYKNLTCTKDLFYISVLMFLNQFLEENENNKKVHYIYILNYILIYSHKKENVLNISKILLNSLKNNNFKINYNKTHFIDKKKNNLILKNFILTYIKSEKNIFDEHGTYLIKKNLKLPEYKKKYFNPLLFNNIKKIKNINNNLYFVKRIKKIKSFLTKIFYNNIYVENCYIHKKNIIKKLLILFLIFIIILFFFSFF